LMQSISYFETNFSKSSSPLKILLTGVDKEAKRNSVQMTNIKNIHSI